MSSNQTRGASARRAMLVNTNDPQEVNADPQSAVVDILTNLMHFCHQQKRTKVDFDAALHTAQGHFSHETACEVQPAAPDRGRRELS